MNINAVLIGLCRMFLCMCEYVCRGYKYKGVDWEMQEELVGRKVAESPKSASSSAGTVGAYVSS